ncbi:MAG: ATP-binding cassette domain-containing protein [Coriobacteriia bacterium]|nr:ATP-binding cassette domain-containing protein [Coriobacteriia bacterium]
MAIVDVRGLAFSYMSDGESAESHPVLRDIDLQVEAGAFCVVTGPTGCGKSTLLRLLKPEISPRGEMRGSIVVDGSVLAGTAPGGMSSKEEAPTYIGFVAQDPESQIVCDTVRAELAFGLENMGVAPHDMSRSIAEIVGFMGLDDWMGRETADLSGGQKQLLNLAAVLAMRPRLILLDEPTAQLDPHSRRRFLDVLGMVNRELGCAIVMSTHMPELVESLATQHFELGPLPPAMAFRESLRLAAAPSVSVAAPCVEARECAFRYGRTDPQVLEDASLSLYKGRIHALLGGNGCGKTTLLKLLAGIHHPQRGKVKASGALRRAYLPQDPKALFACDSVAEELHEWHGRFGYDSEEERRVAARFGLDAMLQRHPYDLSGGQQQQLALAKLLLTKPDVLFLDEPTKGLDAASAAQVTRIIRALANDGAAIAVATHDTAFVRVAADDVSLVFDGVVACTLPASDFFASSLVYRLDAPARLFGALA